MVAEHGSTADGRATGSRRRLLWRAISAGVFFAVALGAGIVSLVDGLGLAAVVAFLAAALLMLMAGLMDVAQLIRNSRGRHDHR
jgi:heme A synthase